MPIRDMLGRSTVSLTRSESRIVQLLLADYPVAGLGSASSLAKRAGVSDPTVARFVTKFGFENFAAFQAALLEDVEARLRSPLMMLETKQAEGEHDATVNRYMASVTQKLRDATEAAVSEPYDRAVDLIMGAKGSVTLVGGRFSRHVAGMLAGYLLQLRSDVHSISPLTLESFDRLVDIGRRDTLIVFDYRRYQTDVVEFARQAEARGAHVILFTDPWMSPVAEVADVVIIASVEVDSPYDSLAPAVAQMEALVAHAVVREKRVMERRVADLEKLRSANAVTVDEPAP
ncbi:MurR/RpiR family transcriptional regulator [Sphingopyxis lindanitolerans]|uniref:MurR/RpiR family transcriptional regulator n=2 Tax=Sphingopyxis lindanitolerans TaxID=2054227 RepID=A0A2S8BA66_9SPHN|nr:MurR/RpiR family transcriptional regulator [Sphingopyxis lindanitolerans]